MESVDEEWGDPLFVFGFHPYARPCAGSGIKRDIEVHSMAKKRGSGKNIASTVEALLLPKVTELGYILWDVVYEKEGPLYYLRITIDSDEGITIDDCERVHRAIDPILDEADPIENSYTLEVSSPGMERELRRPEHFEAFLGAPVEVRFFAPRDGKKSVTGELASYDAESDALTLLTEGAELTMPRAECALIKLVVDFDDVADFDEEE